MANTLQFIFGGGWWVLWHLLMYGACVLPIVAFHREMFQWTWHKTGEPAGAMALWFCGVVLIGLPLLVFTLINGGLFTFLSRSAPFPGGTRALLVISAVIMLGTAFVIMQTAVAGSRSFPALMGSYAIVALVLVLNLWMLNCVRAVPAAIEPVAASVAAPSSDVDVAVRASESGGWHWSTIIFGAVPALIVLAIVGVVGLLVLARVLDIRAAASGVGGRDRADQLIAAYAREHWHNTARRLDANDTWVGLYGCAAKYDPQRDVIITDFDLATNIDRNDAELFGLIAEGVEDPNIGGRYDRRGATIVIDRSERTIRMVREFPVKGMRESTFSKEMDDLWQAARFWSDGYIMRIRAIKRGEMEPPTESLTIEQEWEKIKAKR